MKCKKGKFKKAIRPSLLQLGFAVCCLFYAVSTAAQKKSTVTIVPVGDGWAGNSINTVIFRKNALVTHRDTQFIAYYNDKGYVIVGKRKWNEKDWLLQQTPYKGNIADAHNAISLMVDGEGYLHLSWDHHNNPLRYSKSVSPGSLELTPKIPMTGNNEDKVSYPEFYRMHNGNLLFFYRDGGSGGGNLVINQYNVQNKQWQQLHSNLIDGQGQRNAYWQAYIDESGTVHLSWVWRESPDVASNHDLCYARSTDGGVTWLKSTGEKYNLPITAATAEYAFAIPQQSELINQTSMAADADGHPFIATYWRTAGETVPQYRLVYHDGKSWQHKAFDFRTMPFSLSGGGTKRIPIARPQVVVQGSGRRSAVVMLFRDEARGSKASVVSYKLRTNKWRIIDLTSASVGSWEPNFDTELWRQKKRLHIFLQKVEQVDAEGRATVPPQPVSVLEWKPQ